VCLSATIEGVGWRHAICDVRRRGNERRVDVRITYFASAGTADPTRASIPLHLAANGSVELGHEVSIILGGDAAEPAPSPVGRTTTT